MIYVTDFRDEHHFPRLILLHLADIVRLKAPFLRFKNIILTLKSLKPNPANDSKEALNKTIYFN